MCDQTSEKVDALEAKFRARRKKTDIPYWDFFEKFFINVGHPHRDYETSEKKVPHIEKVNKFIHQCEEPPQQYRIHSGDEEHFFECLSMFFLVVERGV